MIQDKDIKRALEGNHIVRIERSEIAVGSSVGYVVTAASELIALQLVSNEILLNGYTVLRRADVSDFHVPAPYAPFQSAALELRAEIPQTDIAIDLSSIEGALRSISRLSECLTIHIEERDSDVCYIGRVTQWFDDRFELSHLTPAARWEDSDIYAYSDITRIDFAGLYEDALMLVAKHSNPAVT